MKSSFKIQGFLKISLVSMIAFFCRCDSKTKSNKELDTYFINSQLTKADSFIISNAYLRVVRVDTITSNMGCSKVFNCYDIFNNLIVQENKQVCLADLRAICGYKFFFGNKKDTVLKFSFDGSDNVTQVFISSSK